MLPAGWEKIGKVARMLVSLQMKSRQMVSPAAAAVKFRRYSRSLSGASCAIAAAASAAAAASPAARRSL
jgi:hypothetical protein